jgi:hypothetical protein
MEGSEEKKYTNPEELAEQIERLRKERKIARTPEERESLGDQIWGLVKEKSAMRMRLKGEHQKLHEIAEKAESSGVGTGGRGSPPED